MAQQAPVNLQSAAGFAILAGTTVSVTGGGTISGNIGIFPGTAYVPGNPAVTVNGTVYQGGPVAAQAEADLTTAFNDAAGRTVAPIAVAGNIGGLTLAPGLYKSTSSLAISSGDLTLDAQGNPNAVWIFQIASTLTTTSGRQVILAGGASAANIFWQVGSSATIGTTSIFQGNILASVSISMLTGSRLTGRALAMGGAVTVDTGGGSSASLPIPVLQAPTVISTLPTNGAAAVPVANQITATFSTAMNPVSTSTFTLTQGAVAVIGTVAMSGNVATFTPTAPLALSKTYTATITTGAQDLSGRALAANYVWTFDTGSTATPAPAIISGVSGASYVVPGVAGSIVALFGNNLAVGQASAAVPTPLPITLAQSSVTIGGQTAPLFLAASNQINAQVPWSVAGQTQTSVVVTVNGVQSVPFVLPLAASAPGIFSMNATGAGQGAILVSTTAQLASAATPASRDGYISIYCTGLGPVTNQPVTGTGAFGPLAQTLTTPVVTVGNLQAVVSYSGLAPTLVGLYQVNAVVPSSVVPGNSVPVTITMGTVTSNTVTIAVR